MPWLRGLLARAPHLGGDGWHLVAHHRRTGRTAWSAGHSQSRATGVLTVLAAERVLASGPGRWTMADLTTPAEAHRRLLAVDARSSSSTSQEP